MHGLIGDRFLKRFAELLKNDTKTDQLKTQELGSDVITEVESDDPELGESTQSQASKNLTHGEKESPPDVTSNPDK